MFYVKRKYSLRYFMFTIEDSKTKNTCLLPIYIYKQSSASPVQKVDLHSFCPNHSLLKCLWRLLSWHQRNYICMLQTSLRDTLFWNPLFWMQPLVLTEEARIKTIMELKHQLPDPLGMFISWKHTGNLSKEKCHCDLVAFINLWLLNSLLYKLFNLAFRTQQNQCKILGSNVSYMLSFYTHFHYFFFFDWFFKSYVRNFGQLKNCFSRRAGTNFFIK